jgi:hypothetical protein
LCNELFLNKCNSEYIIWWNQAELQLLRGDAEDDHPLTENELKSLQQHVQNYIDDTSCDAVLNVGGKVFCRVHSHAFLPSKELS